MAKNAHLTYDERLTIQSSLADRLSFKAKESPSQPAGKFTKYLTGAHSFIGLILGTENRKDRRTPTGLCNSYWGSADSAFGTC